MKDVQGELFAYIQSKAIRPPDFNCVKGFLKEKLLPKLHRKVGEELDQQEMLCAVSTTETTQLLCVRGTTVWEALNWECLGVGNSALIRYLTERTGIDRPNHNWTQALMLGSYLVSKANKYIGGCRGGPDPAVITNGTCQLRWGKFMDLMVFREFEESLAGNLMALADCVATPDDAALSALASLPGRVRTLRREMRKIWGHSITIKPGRDC